MRCHAAFPNSLFKPQFESPAATRSKQTQANNSASETEPKCRSGSAGTERRWATLSPPPLFLLHIRNTIPEDKIALPSPPWVHLEPLMLCYYSAGWSWFSQSPGARRRLPVLAQPLLGSSFAALTAGSPLPKPRKRHTPLSLHQDPETARAQDHEHKEGGREQKSCS